MSPQQGMGLVRFLTVRLLTDEVVLLVFRVFVSMFLDDMFVSHKFEEESLFTMSAKVKIFPLKN